MTTYRTWGWDEREDRYTMLYSGTDPVEAVRAGLETVGNWLGTFVTENGVIIPQTEAW